MKISGTGYGGLAGMALLAVSIGASAGHSWSDYHWARTVSPFTLQVVDSVTPDWDAELDTALFGNPGWSDSDVLNLTITSDNDKNNVRKRCNSVAGQIRVCNAA